MLRISAVLRLLSKWGNAGAVANARLLLDERARGERAVAALLVRVPVSDPVAA